MSFKLVDYIIYGSQHQKVSLWCYLPTSNLRSLRRGFSLVIEFNIIAMWRHLVILALASDVMNWNENNDKQHLTLWYRTIHIIILKHTNAPIDFLLSTKLNKYGWWAKLKIIFYQSRIKASIEEQTTNLYMQNFHFQWMDYNIEN